MNSGNELSRRAIVAGTVGSTVAASLRAAKPPSPRVIGANDRLRIGIIGMGSQELGHVRRMEKMTESDNIEITAVCDIYQKRLEEGAALTKAKPYKSYLDLIEQPDVDYVLIASPEHWHDQMILDTADAGKHIYCEKPMTFSVEGGLKAIKKIDQTGVKMQVGVQGMSDDSYETAHRYIKEGALGKVVLAQIDYSRNHVGDFWTETVDEDVRPGENLDWKAFLGPAKKRPFDADRFFAWRRYWDYSGGVATDLFIHRLTRIIKACGLTVPSRVVATGGKFVFRASPAEIPDTFNVLIDYPEGMTAVA
jgi:predicted dehydrogenase